MHRWPWRTLQIRRHCWLTAAAQWRSRTAATSTANTAISQTKFINFCQKLIDSIFSNPSHFCYEICFQRTSYFSYRKGLIKRFTDYSYLGLFVPWTVRTIGGLFVPWTFRTLDYSYHPRTVRTIRTMDHSYHHWTIRTVDDSYRHSIISVNSVKATPQKWKTLHLH